ncbi:endonuclease V [Sporosarcina thermotolerans]|uniref:Endonuclease V n=1 Tax=Sporosarcina thermotolerans TaxID=633404 RepID=A0AAW9A7Z2_9BACL|nr:endonuclease V [Sporosarcina thermotolerans]MDW0117751.1 endonuclease V [Sporosarcina thermotolerans]WHT49159.1 endonuclease V [Sporosarcina thermotolerans]
MKIYPVHPLTINPSEFISIQEKLAAQVDVSRQIYFHDIQTVAGVDVAYSNANGKEMGFCHIAVFDLSTMEIMERAESLGHITVLYMPGFLAFRELPLIIEAASQLKNSPDLFLFDGNGILHPRRMGIATHASFFLGIPTIGVAKTYFKVGDSELTEPDQEKGSFTDIIESGEIIGRVLRTSESVKPVFISPGNQIDMDSSTRIALALTGYESRLPIPVREADIAARVMRQKWREDQ